MWNFIFFAVLHVLQNSEYTSYLSRKALYKSSRQEVFLGKGFLKICSKLQENIHAEVRFQKSGKANLLKSLFGIGVLL